MCVGGGGGGGCSLKIFDIFAKISIENGNIPEVVMGHPDPAQNAEKGI